jgi:hypothetical protein
VTPSHAISVLLALALAHVSSRVQLGPLGIADLGQSGPVVGVKQPTDIVDVVRPADGGTTEFVSMRWGLIPSWWKKPLKQLPATFNARAESVADKPRRSRRP